MIEAFAMPMEIAETQATFAAKRASPGRWAPRQLPLYESSVMSEDSRAESQVKDIHANTCAHHYTEWQLVRNGSCEDC